MPIIRECKYNNLPQNNIVFAYFVPQPDITTYELARIIILFKGGDFKTMYRWEFDKIDKDLVKHLKIKDN